MKPQRKLFSRRGGTSIVEVLVSLGIIGILVAIAGSAVVVLLRTFSLYSARAELIDATTRTGERVAAVVRSGVALEATRTIDGTDYTSDADTVIVKVRSIDANGQPIPGAYDYVVFTPNPSDDAQMLEITDPDGTSVRFASTKLLVDRIHSVSFLYRNGVPEQSKDLFFSIMLAHTAAGATLYQNFHVETKLRNA